MNNSLVRLLSIGLVAVGLAAGCASTPEEEPVITQPVVTAEPATQPEIVAPVVEEPKVDPAAEMAARLKAQKALDDAEAAMKRAKSVGYEWRDTAKIFSKAEDAFEDGDFAKAEEQALIAKRQAENALNQYYLELDKKKVAEYEAANLTAKQRSILAEAKKEMTDGNGIRAYQLLSSMEANVATTQMIYEVMRGDSLWKIAGKSSVYGNPYQWPLIYKANANQIKDADLIYAGQRFTIDMNPSYAEKSAAVQHARTRGAWTIGETEDTDMRYLGGY